MGAVQMVCDHCESPLNLDKANMRYVKKFGDAPTGMRLGLCVCGAYVTDKEYFIKMFKEDREREEKKEREEGEDRLAKVVSINR
jgi:hypothetical protein